MKVIIILSIVLLGLNTLRLFASAIVICFTGKITGSDKKLGPKVRAWNMIEATLIMLAFCVLVFAYLKC